MTELDLGGDSAPGSCAAAPSGRATPASTRLVTGPLAREIARFGGPLALASALQTTFNLADAYLVAQLLPHERGPAIGALGICDQVAAIGTILSYGVSSATGTIVAHHKGARDPDAIARTAWQSTLIMIVLGVVFGLLGLVLAGPIVRDVVGAKGEVAEVATANLRVGVGTSFTIFFLLQQQAILRAVGSAKTPVAIMLGGNVLNVVLAIVLIYGPGPAPAAFAWGGAVARALHVPRLGMIGGTWATMLARLAALVPMSMLLARRAGLRAPRRGGRGFDRVEVRRIVSLAWPSSTQFVIRIAAMILVNSLVARYFTNETDQTATTAIGVVFRLDTMALYVAMGWGSAAQVFVGQNMGAREEARANRSGWITAAYDALTNVALIALFFAAGLPILRVFDADPAPVEIALRYLHVVAPSYLGLGLGVVLGNAMAGAGATKTTMWIDVAVILAFQFPLAIAVVAVFGGGLETLFRCVAATNVVSAVAYTAVYLRGGWRRAVVRADDLPIVGDAA